jgi:D-arabinose 1-dehydrogenase-like Zn-dependent alcohol dehydrogenase
MMKAAFFMKNGGPEVFQYGDLPDPKAGAGEVLVDVHAASVNGADWKSRSGQYGKVQQYPYVPGRDFSGVVSALGAGVTDFRVGDPVFGVVEVTSEACYAEKVAIRAAIVAKKPDSLTHVEMASLGLIGLTALVSVEDTLKLKKGETILVQGGAGGVASFGLQVAKHIGARVITTASPITITCASSAPTRSSTTTRKTSPRSCPAWTPCSTPSAATRSRARSPSCGRAGAPRSSDRGTRRPSRRAATSFRCGPTSGAIARTSSASSRS